MRGILSFGAYVPYFRLRREAIVAAHGGGGGKGTRAVASYDQDATTLAVEAARLALRSLGEDARDLPASLWFSTTSPSYVDKTNACAVHAALRLDRAVPAVDVNGAVRSAVGALQAALAADGPALVAAADLRTGLPNSTDERDGGDAAAALVVGAATEGAPVLAEHLGGASLTEEFLDRWRVPGEPRARQWEERFGEMQYVPLATEAWKLALERCGLEAGDVAKVAVSGLHSRSVRSVAGKVGAGTGGVVDDLTTAIGNPGAAQPSLLLTSLLEQAEPGQVVALVVLADGVDVLVFRTTEALAAHRSLRTLEAQVAAGRDDLPYLKFLSWKGMVTLQPPNRPEPNRASASAAARNEDWKFGFVGSRDRGTGAVHLPPARVSYQGGALDDMEPLPMADAQGTIVTYTVDRLAYSPSPPIVFAVVDFDGGGRLPVELTDVDAADVAMGGRVEMTFRRLNAAEGIQNYFWKARPVR
ncbi:MAG: OB-fold domain-containing protein [Acidimicrobiales bacterium]|jgi:3-hydroxy-3-methylglutaryl CoA synthase|nr:OB-fold domain-containing protein [Acidimicrobiales bacterium]